MLEKLIEKIVEIVEGINILIDEIEDIIAIIIFVICLSFISEETVQIIKSSQLIFIDYLMYACFLIAVVIIIVNFINTSFISEEVLMFVGTILIISAVFAILGLFQRKAPNIIEKLIEETIK